MKGNKSRPPGRSSIAPLIGSGRVLNGGSTTALLLLVGATLSASASDQVLFDFTRNLDLPPPVVASDAQVTTTKSPAGSALRVATGHQQPWPGITLTAPSGHWDLSPFAQVSVKLRNAGTNTVTIYCRVDNPGADGTDHCVSSSLGLGADEAGTLKILLKRTSDGKLGGKLFGMRGYPVKAGGPGTIEPQNVTQILLFLSKPTVDHVFDVAELRANGIYMPPSASVTDADPFFPFIDTFGQYRHKDWPGKVHSTTELTIRREKETKELAAQPAPKDWDKFGGWASGPKLKATGFFRTQKTEGKWWLVDPEGRLFFSHGIDCVRMLDATPIAERENWFENFPGNKKEFGEFFSEHSVLKGYYAGKTVRCFSFSGANLLRKYGPNWRVDYARFIHQRLRSWGINTIANWSDPATYQLRLTPYTDSISSGRTRMLEGSEGYWGKFPDVFDPSFAESLRRSMEAKKNASAGDPWCIGYFSDNEMSWGDDTSLAVGVLKSPVDQPAKRDLISDLKAKYVEVAKLNDAWGAKYDSWDALLQSREAPDKSKAADDLKAFYTRAAEQYFRTVRDTIKAVAPHQLYLGCRFAWVNDRAAAAAAKYCDVVSYNLYRRSVADFKFNGGADVPLIIGEFHFGALDRGMFHTGLVPVADQEARAQAYKDYVLGALRHPQFVGCHWFQYMDEPTTGRAYDEENYQIGFVDVADTPYAGTLAAVRQVGYHLYRKP
jgi:hypothetical protein